MSWRCKRISEMAQLVNGYPFDSADFSPSGDLPLVRIRDITAETFETYVSRENTPSSAMIRDDDVVIGMDGDFNVALWQRGSAALNQRVCLLRANEHADARYLAYSLPPHLQVINDLTYSTTVKHLSGSQVLHIRFEAPPPDEQRAIADYLDQETAQIDALVAKQEEFIGLLRERRLSQITDAFSKLGEPNSELRRVARVQTGVTLSGEGDHRHRTWPYLRVANVQMGRVDLEEVKEIYLSPGDAQASMLRAGDVLMTEGGDIDKLGRGTVWDGSIDPIVHQNHVFAVRVNRNRLVPEYLAWWLDTVTSRKYFYLTAKKTTNLASTNKTVVGKLPVSVPSVDEQRAIVRRIEEQISRIDTLIAKAEEHVALAKERRSALITAAVTGQIDVRTARKAG